MIENAKHTHTIFDGTLFVTNGIYHYDNYQSSTAIKGGTYRNTTK
jgi:hypothetical protein